MARKKNKRRDTNDVDSNPLNTPDQVSTEPLSKTALKQLATEAQKLGKRIAQLSDEQFDRMALPDRLAAAITDYNRFPSREAKRRQLQFVGRLMRDLDTSGIEAQLDKLEGISADARYQQHQLELWRNRLLSEPEAVTEFISTHPQVDRQQLRQLVKSARSTQGSTSEKHAARALFRFIRDQGQST